MRTDIHESIKALDNTREMPSTKGAIAALGANAEGLSLLVAPLRATGDKVLFAWQPDLRQHAASLIKVPIMLELLKRASEGSLSLEERIVLKAEDQVGGCGTLQLMTPGSSYQLLELMRLMICISDNTATNMLIEYLGKEAINETLRRMGFKDTQVARKLMVGDFSIFSTTTAAEMAHCLRLVADSEALSPEMRRLGLDTLAQQQYNDRISALWEEQLFWHKTGEVTGVIHDAGIAVVAGETYVVAVLQRDLESNHLGVQRIQHLGHCILEDLMALGGVAQ